MAYIEEKKPHPLSKEWRALKEARMVVKENVSELTSEIDVDEKVVVKEEKSKDTPELSKILKRLEKLELENQELKADRENMFTKAKEKYEWPRKYSYKQWWGIPVLSYESYRKDPSKDLSFKNNFWHYESNHYLKLNLANGETVNVEVTEFNRDYSRSEYYDAEMRTDNRGNILWYVFEDDTYGVMVVAPNAIN